MEDGGTRANNLRTPVRDLGARARSHTRRALERVGILDLRQKKMDQLSGGTVQKIGIAQAILHQPSVLILDEPMAGLDPTARFELRGYSRNSKRKGPRYSSRHIS